MLQPLPNWIIGLTFSFCFQNWSDLDNDTDALLDSILIGNDRFDAGCDVISDRSCDVMGDARLSFDTALSDDGSEDSGFEPPPIMSPPSSSSPEPVELQDVHIGINFLLNRSRTTPILFAFVCSLLK